jgi:hypothetical protein
MFQLAVRVVDSLHRALHAQAPQRDRPAAPAGSARAARESNVECCETGFRHPYAYDPDVMAFWCVAADEQVELTEALLEDRAAA